MFFTTHGLFAFAVTYVPLSYVFPEPVPLVAGLVAGALAAWPDVDGERAMWRVEVGWRNITENGSRDVKNAWMLFLARLGSGWEQYHRWHEPDGDLHEWAKKYWVYPILLHVAVLDPLIHPPTSIVDREEHPVLYWVSWGVLEVLVNGVSYLMLRYLAR